MFLVHVYLVFIGLCPLLGSGIVISLKYTYFSLIFYIMLTYVLIFSWSGPSLMVITLKNFKVGFKCNLTDSYFRIRNWNFNLIRLITATRTQPPKITTTVSLKSKIVPHTHNFVCKLKYDKNKAVVITKADYVFSEYELKK